MNTVCTMRYKTPEGMRKQQLCTHSLHVRIYCAGLELRMWQPKPTALKHAGID